MSNLIGKVLNGKEFKQLYGDIFYKTLHDNLIHYNHKYVDGINVCSDKFNPLSITPSNDVF